MVYDVAEYIYSLPEETVAKMLSWAWNTASNIDDLTPMEQKAKDAVATAIAKLEKKG